MSSIWYEIGYNLICASLTGIVVSLVCLCTQLFLFQKCLQYKLTDKAITLAAATEAPMVKNVFSFIEDQKL